eukprot:CAMPEP_0167793158 /NCGR_PEP_ID=MMETSP0111_2-20121227/13003_1 /TAXON_ID=91324 /ORGANISM="Lotharella globosa, Strain CCCM811" /LENGTH=139 /DNA_ID=CAMNT_0007686241 /DNA_START=603 /DNA_END=1025 /DNA_ORIENTATION=+
MTMMTRVSELPALLPLAPSFEDVEAPSSSSSSGRAVGVVTDSTSYPTTCSSCGFEAVMSSSTTSLGTRSLPPFAGAEGEPDPEDDASVTVTVITTEPGAYVICRDFLGTRKKAIMRFIIADRVELSMSLIPALGKMMLT